MWDTSLEKLDKIEYHRCAKSFTYLLRVTLRRTPWLFLNEVTLDLSFEQRNSRRMCRGHNTSKYEGAYPWTCRPAGMGQASVGKQG